MKLIKNLWFAFSKTVLVVSVFLSILYVFFQFSSHGAQLDIDRAEQRLKEQQTQLYKLFEKPEYKDAILRKLLVCNVIGELCDNFTPDRSDSSQTNLASSISNLIVYPYTNPPASFTYTVYDTMHNAGFIPQAYAAKGVGFASLQPLSNIWRLFRDVAYLLLVLILVSIGFMIMFRKKIDPQTVVGIESALPRIVITLILITFSFAIAGFLIDLMYVALTISISILSKNTVTNIDVIEYQNNVLIGGGFLFDAIIGNGKFLGIGGAIFGLLPRIADLSVRTLLTGGVFALLFHFGNPLQWFTNIVQGFGIILSILLVIAIVIVTFFFSPLLLSLIALLTAILVFFRLLILVFKTYLSIIILILFSPLILLLQAIPGQNIFSFWIKNLAGNLLTFPIIVVTLITGVILVDISAAGNSFWQAPFLHGIEPKSIGVLVGIGLIFLTPQLVHTTRKALGLGAGLGIGPGLFFGAVPSAISAGIAHGTRYAPLAYMSKGIQTRLGLGQGDNPTALGRIVQALSGRGGH